MIDFMVRWILKVTRFTSGILLGSGLTLTENIVLGVLNCLIELFGKFVHRNYLHLIKHYFQINKIILYYKEGF